MTTAEKISTLSQMLDLAEEALRGCSSSDPTPFPLDRNTRDAISDGDAAIVVTRDAARRALLSLRILQAREEHTKDVLARALPR
jgi:hypothetical protein